MLTHRWPKINSDFICIYENIAGGRGSASAPDPAGGAHDAPPDRHVGPPTACDCGARTLRLAPSMLVPRCPNYGHLTQYERKSNIMDKTSMVLQIDTVTMGRTSKRKTKYSKQEKSRN